MLLLGRFLNTAKYGWFYFLNTHFIIKVGANGYASTTSSHVTPTLLSHTSSFHPAAPKNCSASPQISFKKVIVFGETNLPAKLKKKALFKRKRKGCPANANWLWHWLSALWPKQQAFSPSHSGRAAKNRASCAQCPFERKKETWKNSHYLWARKISFLHSQAMLCGAEVNEKRARLVSTACSTPTRWLPAPWRHFFSSLLPQPPPTILKWLCMSHTPTSKHKAPRISLFHAQAIPSITFLFSRDYKNLGCRHKGHTSVHAPTPRQIVWNASGTSTAGKYVPDAGMLHGWGIKNKHLCHPD